MKQVWVLSLAILFFTGSIGWALDVEVSKTGAVKTIQEAVDQIGNQGGTITITDSGVYEDTVLIGSEYEQTGSAITLTSTKTGDERPVISPLGALGPFEEAHQTSRLAGVAIMIDGSVVSNVIVEANPEAEGVTGNGCGALFIMSDNFVMDNVLIRPRAGTSGETNYPNSAVFFAQEGGSGSSALDGRSCNGTIVRNCEFIGVATDKETEPTDTSNGYLASITNGQLATLLRTDHYTRGDQDVTITVENSTFKYGYDAGIFFSNREGGSGKLTLNIKDSFFDAFGKFEVGVRGVFLNVERSIFSRACQGNHGDGENSALRIQEQNGRIPDANISNCLFVNCGSAYSKKAYYGGVNNHNGGIVNVDHCTFDLCASGVTLNNPKPESVLNVSNCIFSRIGYNAAPGVDVEGHSPADADPFVLWWENNFDTGQHIEAVFNNYNDLADGVLNVNNCIVFDIADEQANNAYLPGDEVEGVYLTAGTVSMTGVVKADPQFANMDYTADAPYSLAEGSPAIDGGVAASPGAGNLDMDGSVRVIGSAADIGAQEFGTQTSILEWSIF